MSTILKWAGNKTAVMSELKKHLPAGPRLVEPFAGSCAVMMETDYPCYLVADINPDLINLYKKVAADCESFISRARVLFEIANREVAYYNIRQEFNYSTEITDFMKAVYFLYLNRHGYRGLCRYNAKWHLNRSQFGIRIDHDLASISDHSLASQSITIWHASDH
ncbi:Dam family site-specific DNA-(adenine-N6)-methyltransferase [Escherichia coli]|uniref:Dam family site-specific DNA-(adenine-N6)-methyltransferase n=1 Tax=Escherichia coli TaxID=562 RepID=UPI0023786BE6|nr:Dam family site-specific DNA-(adenine-N6)-methyltransferase [Escherichia coli]